MRYILIVLVLVFISCSTQPKNDFEVKGQIATSELNGTTIYLYKVAPIEVKYQLIDSVVIKNGMFSFKAPVESIAIYALDLNKESSYANEFYVDKGSKVAFKIESKTKFYEPTIQSDLDFEKNYKALAKKMDAQLESDKEHYKKMRLAFFEHSRGINEMEASEEWLHKKDSLKALLNAEVEKKKLEKAAVIKSYINEHPKSAISPLLLLKPYDFGLTAGRVFSHTELQELLDIFEQNQNEAPNFLALLAHQIKEQKTMADAQETFAVGKPYKDFEAFDPQGDYHHFSDFIDGKSYVLLDFWASWCGPCRAENPNVLKVYDQFKDRGFKVVAFSLDNDNDRWQRAIKEDKMPWIHLSDLRAKTSPIPLLYGVKGIPDNILFDAEGKVVARGLKGLKLKKKMQELLDS